MTCCEFMVGGFNPSDELIVKKENGVVLDGVYDYYECVIDGWGLVAFALKKP